MTMADRPARSAGDRAGALFALVATVTGLGSAAAFAMLPEVQQSFAPTPAFLGSIAADALWLRIDPGGVLQTLTIGTWLVIAATLGRLRAGFPAWLTAIGLVAAAGFLFAAISAATGALGEPNVVVVLLVAGIVIPVWFAGLASILVRPRVPAPPGPKSEVRR